MTEQPKPERSILIAEDDLVSRHLLETILGKWGYRVIAVSDGLEALRVLKGDDAPSLAILDWMMPGMEGPEVCRRVRELPQRPYTYIVLLTARTQQGDLLRGLESGADGYLTKPFDAEELRARVHVGERIVNLQNNLLAAREELEFRATHDALTGIWNRGVVLDALQRECSRQAREGGSVGTIMIDLDHFKQVNDTHGHPCGDIVLREIARRLGSCVRPYDTLGRYGGEEFLVVVPSADSVGALRMAERMREAIRATPITTQQGPVRITASLGVAVSGNGQLLNPEALLRLADDALYRAKARGRNCCELAPPVEPEAPASEEQVPAPLRSGSQ
ncbi:MAG: diguanylate cyclase [Acidobacteriia bacterium]|nr:diguanylate cyclase [Terriglobia bacterium]